MARKKYRTRCTTDPREDAAEIRDALSVKLVESGLSQSAFADCIGVSRQTVARICDPNKGAKQYPLLATVIAVADQTGADILELLPERFRKKHFLRWKMLGDIVQKLPEKEQDFFIKEVEALLQVRMQHGKT